MSAQPLYEISNPAGFWRCTHSTFPDFVVGKTYPCLHGSNGGYRIYPKLHQQAWSPYWEIHNARFCYSADQLDFVFVRRFQGDEESRLQQARRAPAPTYPEISQPLEFIDETPAPTPKPARKFPLTRNHLKNASIFLAGALTASLVLILF